MTDTSRSLLAALVCALAHPALAEGAAWSPLDAPIDPADIDVVESRAHTCARLGAEVACWGRGRSPSPAPIDFGAPVTRLLDATPCALVDDGTVRCRGTPTGAAEGAGPFTDAVVAAGTLMCGLRPDGSVSCGDEAPYGPDVPSGAVTYDRVYGSRGVFGLQACARTTEGDVHCWRADGKRPVRGPKNQLFCQRKGAPAEGTEAKCTRVGVRFKGPATHVTVGRARLCLVLADHRARCYGQKRGALLREKVLGMFGADIIDIAAGPSHSCFVEGEGGLHCFGDNDHGQLGDGTVQAEAFPVEAFTPDDEDGGWTRTFALSSSTCGVHRGRLYCWGSNQHGALGHGRVGDLWSSPRPLAVGHTTEPEAWPVPAFPPRGLVERYFDAPHTVPLPALYARSCVSLLRPCAASGGATPRAVRVALRATTDDDGWVRLEQEGSSFREEQQRCIGRALQTCPLPEASHARLTASLLSGGDAALAVSTLARARRYGARPHRAAREERLGAPPCYGRATGWTRGQWPPQASIPARPMGTMPDLEVRACELFRGEDERHVVRLDLRDERHGTYLGSVTTRDGELHGPVRVYDDKGFLRVDEAWKDGAPRGRHRRWDATGGVVFDCRYSRGRPSGRCRTWFPAPDDPRRAEQRTGRLQSERFFDDDGRPVGMHRVWWPRGTRRESVSFPDDVRGTVGLSWAPTGPAPSVIVRGRKDAKGSRRWILEPKTGVVLAVEDHDRLGDREVTHLACDHRDGVVDRALGRLLEGTPAPARFDEGPTPTGAALDLAHVSSAYTVSVSQGADGKVTQVVLMGRAGANVEGDLWEVRPIRGSTAVPEGFERKGRLAWRRGPDQCRPLAELGLEVPAPVGVTTERIEVGQVTHGLFANDRPSPGDTLEFRVKSWRRDRFVDCQLVESERLDEHSPDVPSAVKARVRWYETIVEGDAHRFVPIDDAEGASFEWLLDDARPFRVLAWTDDERPPHPGCGALYDPGR